MYFYVLSLQEWGVIFLSEFFRLKMMIVATWEEVSLMLKVNSVCQHVTSLLRIFTIAVVHKQNRGQ